MEKLSLVFGHGGTWERASLAITVSKAVVIGPKRYRRGGSAYFGKFSVSRAIIVMEMIVFLSHLTRKERDQGKR